LSSAVPAFPVFVRVLYSAKVTVPQSNVNSRALAGTVHPVNPEVTSLFTLLFGSTNIFCSGQGFSLHSVGSAIVAGVRLHPYS
jgi:hypothetical protein